MVSELCSYVYYYILVNELEMRIASQDKWISLLRMNYEKIRRENAKIFMGTSDFIAEEEYLLSAKRILD